MPYYCYVCHVYRNENGITEMSQRCIVKLRSRMETKEFWLVTKEFMHIIQFHEESQRSLLWNIRTIIQTQQTAEQSRRCFICSRTSAVYFTNHQLRKLMQQPLRNDFGLRKYILHRNGYPLDCVFIKVNFHEIFFRFNKRRELKLKILPPWN